MAISTSIDISTTITSPVTNSLSVGTVVYDDTNDSIFIPITTAQNPISFTLTGCTTTNLSTTVTTTGGKFLDVRVGDIVTGTEITGTVAVASIDEDGNSLVLDTAATASGTVTLTFDPPAVTATLYGLEVTHGKNGSDQVLTIALHTYDGSLEGTTGTASNSTAAIDLVTRGLAQVKLDMNTFLGNLRVI